MNKQGKRLLSILLCMVLLFTALPGSLGILVDAEDDNEITIIVGSDFQNKNGNSAGKNQVGYILEAMEEDGITQADAFFFCGDYDYDTERTDYYATNSGIEALQSVMSTVVDEENMIFVQGNHDVPSKTTLSGNNDPENGDYGVFVINNDDYMVNNDDEETVRVTAQHLIEYLNEKIAIGYDKPIFILSHLPLHYSMRTQGEGDGQYANYLFDALNAAGEKGLNLFFLHGHDHSNGWDDYLGGAAVFLKKGDEILIAQNSQLTYQTETLQFTYLNAGYVGYYNNENGADDTLTMTAIKIQNNQVTFTRYDKKGVHDLKSAGVRNSYKGESGYEPNKTVYTSPQTVELTAVSDKTPLSDFITIPKTGRQYTRITSADQLMDGGQYLLIYDAIPNYFVLPQVVTKANDEGVSRIGFDLESTSAFGAPYIYGEYADKEWTFMAAEDGWRIGHDGKNIKLTKTTKTAITATLEDEGNVFTIIGDNCGFVFQSGDYVMNYNARHLMNAFTGYPTVFYIYQFTGYVTEEVIEDGNDTPVPNENTWLTVVVIVSVLVVIGAATIGVIVWKKKH